MPPTTAEVIARRATAVAQDDASGPGLDELIALAGTDRSGVEAARDLVASRVQSRVDDWSATGALTLLNQALSRAPRTDPMDWRERWGRRRKP